MTRQICPRCGRLVTVRSNKFGDAVFVSHKLATAWEPGGKVSAETAADLRPGYNPEAKYTYELDCPMSGQPVED